MKYIIAALLFLTAVRPALAADHPLTGTWKLVSVETVVLATGEKKLAWGPKSEGLMTIAANGQSFTIMVPEDPKAPLNVNMSTHHLTGATQTTIYREMAVNPGPDQVRDFTLEGDKLTMATPIVKGADGQERRSLVHWIRLR